MFPFFAVNKNLGCSFNTDMCAFKVLSSNQAVSTVKSPWYTANAVPTEDGELV